MPMSKVCSYVDSALIFQILGHQDLGLVLLQYMFFFTFHYMQ